MRSRTTVVACLAVGALAACSNPSADGPAADADSRFTDELELAIFPDRSGGDLATSTVSDLEITRPENPAPPSSPPSDAPPEAVAIRVPSPAIAMAGVSPRVHVPHAEGVELDPVTAHAGPPVTREVSGSGTVTGVIIRGGVDRRDPCAIHFPGGGRDAIGAIGVLINDPSPLGGSGRVGGSGRDSRGGIFAGGIR